MTRRVVCLMVALLFVFAAANIATADEAATTPAPAGDAVIVNDCNGCVAPCYTPCCDPCYPTVVYRRGFFGCYRPVYAAPCYYPRYYGCGWGWRGGCYW